MKKILCALGLMFTAVSSALATTYPLTIENCGYQETFTRPPERVVALGQNTVEILLLLGLQKQVVASAFWPTSVLPQLAEQNAKIKTLTVEIPSLESVLAQNPDFVPAQLPLLLGPESKVARREDLAYYEKRGNAENYIKEAKYDMAVGHLLLKSFWANEAVFQMMMLSYNLFLLFKFDSLDSSEYRQQIKTFRLKYVFLAAKIIKTARYVIMKLSENYPYKGVYEKCLV